jgi:ribulose kinase
MHADATGLPVVVGECDNAPLLGSAILAAVGAGQFNVKGDDGNSETSVLNAVRKAVK